VATATGVRLLLVSGSTRRESTNTAALRTVPSVAPDGVATELYQAMADLPHFNPDDDHEPLDPTVAALRHEIARSDAVLFCTPEYAGALPGSFKNLLDWTVGGTELYGKPVAWINVAAEGRGANAEASLATVLGYVGATVVTDACARLRLSRDSIGADGTVADTSFRHALSEVVEMIRQFLRNVET
jgi:chromate reductase